VIGLVQVHIHTLQRHIFV